MFSTALGQGPIWWREVKTTKRQLSHLALRIAAIFERFAHDCLERLWVHGAYVNTDGEQGVWNPNLPKLTGMPNGKERWRDLDTRLTSRILDFDPHRRVVQNKIDDAYEHID